MAGYALYSLDWDKFRRFVDGPSRAQLLAYCDRISKELDAADDQFKDDDPLGDWPSEPEETRGSPSGILR